MKRIKRIPATSAQEESTVVEHVGDNKAMVLLQALHEPMTPAALFERAGIPRSTGYRILEKLIGQGGVVAEGDLVRLSDAGKARVMGNPAQDDVRPLERLWPWLRLLPTVLHRAFLILALFTLSARRSNCVDDRHPGLILLGSTQLLKSWLCKILCFLAGSTPDRCRVPMQQVRQRGLLVRLDAKGEISYTSEQLAEPFLWLEEFSLAEPGVLRDVTALMQGAKTLRIENQKIDVAAVPLLEMNPVKNSDVLCERLGLRPERIRRNFVADFSAIKVTRAMRASAGEVAARIKEVGALSIPPAAANPLAKETLELIDDAMSSLVMPEMIDYVDPSRIHTAVLGARAWLSERDAVHETLWCWCELAESTQFLVKNWRARLASLLTPVQPTAESAHVPPIQNPTQSENLKTSPHPQKNGDQAMNRYRLNDILLEVKELLNAAGLRVPEDSATIKTFLTVIVQLIRQNISPAHLLSDPGQWVRLQKLQQLLDAQKLTISNVETLIQSLNGSAHAVSQQRAVLLLWSPTPTKSRPSGVGLQLFEEIAAPIHRFVPQPEYILNLLEHLQECLKNFQDIQAELLAENEGLRAENAQLRQLLSPPTMPAHQKFTSTSDPNIRA